MQAEDKWENLKSEIEQMVTAVFFLHLCLGKKWKFHTGCTEIYLSLFENCFLKRTQINAGHKAAVQCLKVRFNYLKFKNKHYMNAINSVPCSFVCLFIY